MSNDNPNTHAIKVLASKVLFALSVNFFNAVFNRISSKLQELASCPDENPDYSDIELIQHINVDVNRLTKLLTGTLTTDFYTIIVCVNRNPPANFVSFKKIALQRPYKSSDYSKNRRILFLLIRSKKLSGTGWIITLTNSQNYRKTQTRNCQSAVNNCLTF